MQLRTALLPPARLPICSVACSSARPPVRLPCPLLQEDGDAAGEDDDEEGEDGKKKKGKKGGKGEG